MFTDTHAHLNYVSEKTGFSEKTIIQQSVDANVTKIINIGCDIASSTVSIQYAKEYPNKVFAAVGIHPNTAYEFDLFSEIELLTKENPITAIGETGLDYYRNRSEKTGQEKLFRKHIELALDLNKPVIIHCRDAYEDTIRIIKDYPTCIFIMHSYAGSAGQTDIFFSMPNIYFGINGIVTFKNALDLQKIVTSIPLERIILETDCPFLAPEPNRGKTNYPAYIPFIAQKLAQLQSISAQEVENKTTETAQEIFSL